MSDDDALLLLALGGLYLMSRSSSRVITDAEWGTGWGWPVAAIQTFDGKVYAPVVSDGMGSPRPDGRAHRGVDIMFKRKSAGDRAEYAPRTHDGSPLFFAPRGTPVLAARDGVIWSAGLTPHGYSVVIDHGKPFATYYTHLEGLAVPVHAGGKNLMTQLPTRVRKGDIIGVMGYSPKDGAQLRHLHFAVWHNGAGEGAAIDPERSMVQWARPPHREVTRAKGA